MSMNGEAVVLDQNRLRRQLIAIDQLRDRFCFAHVNTFAIE